MYVSSMLIGLACMLWAIVAKCGKSYTACSVGSLSVSLHPLL